MRMSPGSHPVSILNGVSILNVSILRMSPFSECLHSDPVSILTMSPNGPSLQNGDSPCLHENHPVSIQGVSILIQSPFSPCLHSENGNWVRLETW